METTTKIEVLPDALYTPVETAEILGFRGTNPKSRTNAVYNIPAGQLPRTPTGPRGGNVMFRGRDILAFLDDRRRTQ